MSKRHCFQVARRHVCATWYQPKPARFIWSVCKMFALLGEEGLRDRSVPFTPSTQSSIQDLDDQPPTLRRAVLLGAKNPVPHSAFHGVARAPCSASWDSLSSSHKSRGRFSWGGKSKASRTMLKHAGPRAGPKRAVYTGANSPSL